MTDAEIADVKRSLAKQARPDCEWCGGVGSRGCGQWGDPKIECHPCMDISRETIATLVAEIDFRGDLLSDMQKEGKCVDEVARLRRENAGLRRAIQNQQTMLEDLFCSSIVLQRTPTDPKGWSYDSLLGRIEEHLRMRGRVLKHTPFSPCPLTVPTTEFVNG